MSDNRWAPGIFALIAAAACHHPPAPIPVPAVPRPVHTVIPLPAQAEIVVTDSFLCTARTPVLIAAEASDEVQAIGDYAANVIASRAGATARRLAAGASAPDSSIALQIDSMRADLGPEGYELRSTRLRVSITAARPAGLFYGVQTMRQLLPPSVEHQAAYVGRRLMMPAARVTDTPRFPWRGAMLDVSRHFLAPADVKHFIDAFALYKLNRLHLHLADDQGWRIDIPGWPKLTAVGGASQVGGGVGGFYTREQYADIVAYARSRYVTIVPEIDMPGHINAALLSYPDLRCNRTPPAPFTAVGGPPNTLCVERDSVYRFIADVVRGIASAAPTPYFHIGGDEVSGLTSAQYRAFVERVQDSVAAQGITMVGWADIAPARIRTSTVIQHWNRDSTILHTARGGKVIMSPGPRAYLDMKYDSSTVLGLRWAGLIDLRRAYDWNPATELPGVGESSVMGVESPLWAETLITRQDYEYLAFPRVIAIAELGWSPAASSNWESFRARVGAHGARLAAIGVNFARVPGVAWSW